jgi:pyruvate dehydrogenase E1 component alpha subunit
MGDGSTNIGVFHESLNIAALWHLPIVYVIINNRLGMGTTVNKAAAEPDLYERASSYRMASARVDGLDPLAVYEAAQRAIDTARGGKPFLLEVVTERLRGHSVVDPAKYRSTEEVAELKVNDPVHTFAARLVAEGLLDDDALAKIDEEVMAWVAEAAAFAEGSPFPDISTLFDYTYATPVPNDSRRLPGQALFEPAPFPASVEVQGADR